MKHKFFQYGHHDDLFRSIFPCLSASICNCSFIVYLLGKNKYINNLEYFLSWTDIAKNGSQKHKKNRSFTIYYHFKWRTMHVFMYVLYFK